MTFNSVNAMNINTIKLTISFSIGLCTNRTNGERFMSDQMSLFCIFCILESAEVAVAELCYNFIKLKKMIRSSEGN